MQTYTDDGEFYDDLQWTVNVMPKNPSFKSVSKKMKSFKQKYLKYKSYVRWNCKGEEKGKRKNICRHILMMENFMTIYNGQLPNAEESKL